MTHLPLAQRIEEYQIQEKKQQQNLLAVSFLAAVLILGGLYLVFSCRQPKVEKASEIPVPMREEAAAPAQKEPQEESQPKPAFERGNYSINILDGSTDPTHFLELAEAFKGLGYQVTEGKAPYSSYTLLNLGLKFETGELDKYLREDMAKVFSDTQIDDLEESTEYDAVIVVGKF